VLSRLLCCASLGAIAPNCALCWRPRNTLSLDYLGRVGRLSNILDAAGKMNELEKVSLHVEEFGGLEGIEDSQSHENSEIYRISLAIR
jgi:importin subunit alpha-2